MVESFLIIGGSSDIAMLLAKQLDESGHKVSLAQTFLRHQNCKKLESMLYKGTLWRVKPCTSNEQAKINGDGQISGAAHLVGRYYSNLHML